MDPRDDRQEKMARVLERDPRYPIQAYQWLHLILDRTQSAKYAGAMPDDSAHVSGEELLEMFKAVSLEEFGPMASTVLREWGITRTEDFGNLVFNMIRGGLLSASEEDSPADYADGFDFATVFDEPFAEDGSPPEPLPPID